MAAKQRRVVETFLDGLAPRDNQMPYAAGNRLLQQMTLSNIRMLTGEPVDIEELKTVIRTKLPSTLAGDIVDRPRILCYLNRQCGKDTIVATFMAAMVKYAFSRIVFISTNKTKSRALVEYTIETGDLSGTQKKLIVSKSAEFAITPATNLVVVDEPAYMDEADLSIVYDFKGPVIFIGTPGPTGSIEAIRDAPDVAFLDFSGDNPEFAPPWKIIE